MSRRQEKIWNDPIAQVYNEKYGRIGIGLCYKIVHTFGDTKYSQDFCKWIADKRKTDKTWDISWDDMVMQFNIQRI
jgi:hypothetical protein